MNILPCDKCKADTPHLQLTNNQGGFQYQYLECTGCKKKTPTAKIPIPKYFEEAIRKKSMKPIDKFNKEDIKRRKKEGF